VALAPLHGMCFLALKEEIKLKLLTALLFGYSATLELFFHGKIISD
jgi:hypothetical protein